MKNCVIALGYFDSMHIGHRYLLSKGKELAIQYKTELLPITFDDGFLSALGRNESEIYLLNERKLLLKEMGINYIFSFPIEKEFLNKTKENFLEYIASFCPKVVVIGKDYRFGKNALGTFTDAINFFSKLKIKVEIVELIKVNEEKVSSTQIRKYLQVGDIEKANNLLGESFFYSGFVEHGRAYGHLLGFPTINIKIPKYKIRIRRGVYKTKILYNNRKYLSITNVGEHPTFNDTIFNIETHILDFDKNIYGSFVRIEFDMFLREIIKFESETDLIKQIQKDILIVRGCK